MFCNFFPFAANLYITPSESAKVVVEHPTGFLAADSSFLQLVTPILATPLQNALLNYIAVSACLCPPSAEAKQAKRKEEQDADELSKHDILVVPPSQVAESGVNKGNRPDEFCAGGTLDLNWTTS